uniref:SWIB domain-containing protein n=1 Tax=viral metagenome TaxID=1070528 RepID=A0A6C0HRR3_9ZZZZ
MGKERVKQSQTVAQVVGQTEPKTPRKKAPVQEPIPVVAETQEVKSDVVVVNEIVEEDELSSSLTDLFSKHLSKLQDLTSFLNGVKADFKLLEKRWSKELRVAQKGMKRKKNANRQPSGFVKPTRISEELADFLEKPHGSEMARTQVTREINTYIRAHSLATGRNINPDAKLLALLKIPPEETLTYFNLQRYMSPHFYKNVKVEVPV